MFSTLPKRNFHFLATYILSSVNTLNLDQSKILSFGKVLTLSQTSPCFHVSVVKVFWKHCRKRRNCSYQAIWPFSQNVSTCSEHFLPFSSNVKLLSANSCSLAECNICCLGKGSGQFCRYQKITGVPVLARLDVNNPLLGDKILAWFLFYTLADSKSLVFMTRRNAFENILFSCVSKSTYFIVKDSNKKVKIQQLLLHFPAIKMKTILSTRVLSRNQIHWDKWPTKFEKGGLFQKIYGALVNFPYMYMMPMVYQHLDKLKRRRNCQTVKGL